MFARHLVIAAASVLCATAATAQTHGQLLERAIFAEDTAGDLSGAIRIYEQLASAPAVSPEIAARARTRLSDARRERDLAANAAATLADQSKPQTGLPGQIDPPPAAPRTTPPAAPRYADMYDASRTVTVVGFVTEVQWSNPDVVVYLNDADGKLWGLVLAPPANLERTGWTRDSVKVGDQMRADGTLAKGVGADCPAPVPTGCATFPNGALNVNARQMLLLDGNGNLTRPGTGQPASAGGARGGRGGRGGGGQ
jgi:hypothetical protein